MTNEVKNVPEIRFPEFDDEWKEKKFYECVEIEGKLVNPNFHEYQNLPHIGPGNIQKNTGRILNYNLVKDENLISGKFEFDEEDIIYGKINPQLQKICIPGFRGLASADTYPIKTISGVSNTYFIYYSLFTSRFFKYSVSVSMRTGMPKINKEELGSYNFYLPKIMEQQKIGGFFSKLDRQIELEEQKLEKLEEQKKGYMQKLFSQEIRFKDNQGNNYPDWKIVEIGDILEERTERSGEGDMLSVTINNGIIKFDEIDRKDNSSKDKSNYRKVYKDDIAYNSMRMWQGASGKSEYEGIVSPAYTVTIPSENINPDFIAYYFKTHKMIHKFKINSQGLTSDTWNLKYRQLKDIKLNLCSKEEQNKIANLLIMYDKLINKQKHKLEILKTNKKGFLQKMFV